MRAVPTEAHLRAVLRFDYVYFAIGVLIFTVGVLSIVESWLVRPRHRMVTLFGVIGILYGGRLLVQLGTVQFALGLSNYAAAQVIGVLSYLMPTVGIFLWSTLVSRRSRKILLMAVAAHALFAMIGIPHDLLTHHPWSFPQFNSGLVIASSLLTAAVFVADIRSGFIPLDVPIRAIVAGFIVFELGVLYDNLVPLHIVPAVWTEPFGFVGFLFGMGFGIQYRISAARNRLALLHAEMEQARKIQLSILPAGPPANTHYQVAAQYSPMTSVAGDLYDFIALEENRLGLFIADVAGHGVAAALVASMLKTAINIQTRSTTSPALLLADLNRHFCGQSHGQFVTAAFAVLDPERQTLTYAAAGHPPLLLWADGAHVGAPFGRKWPAAGNPANGGVFGSDGAVPAGRTARHVYRWHRGVRERACRGVWARPAQRCVEGAKWQFERAPAQCDDIGRKLARARARAGGRPDPAGGGVGALGPE